MTTRSTCDPISTTRGRWAGLTAQAHIDTPLGGALLVASDAGLAGFWFNGQAHHPLAADHLVSTAEATSPGSFGLPEVPSHPMLAPAIAQLADYWRGERRHFELALDLRGTPFQQAVWQQLLAIGCGDTSTYGTVATQIGKAAAVRAVGAAVGRNPVSVIVPCHRVVGGNGDLTGYAGGLDRKRALLTLEGVALGEAGRTVAVTVKGQQATQAASSAKAATSKVPPGKVAAGMASITPSRQLALDLTSTSTASTGSASITGGAA